jgi:hypothetical protein
LVIGEKISKIESDRNMRGILIPLALIISLMGCAAALDGQKTLETQPGEAMAEKMFEIGIGQPW